VSEHTPEPGDAPVAIVTGAAGGIGGAIARELAASGFDLVLVDITSDDQLDALASEVRSRGNGCAVHRADIADLITHEGIVAKAVGTFGRLDCLVNNAGVSVLVRGDILDVTAESFDRCAAINARALFFLTQAVARHFLTDPAGNHHRSIVSITSSSALAVSVDRAEYCISKAAASMASKAFAVRLAAHGVGVYEIQPGVIDTPMIAPSRSRYESMIEEGRVPVPRLGRPEDVARAVTTVARGLLPYTVGQSIAVDGGLMLARY
jgi:NAD(P)-dependent dehydrogenase (short-subunit alcohol dehydrogenase family)